MSRPGPPSPPVVACGLSAEALAEVRAAAGAAAELLAGDPAQARRWLAAREDAVLVLGDQLAPDAALALVHARPPRPGAPRPLNLALAAGEDLSLWAPYVAADALFYLSRRPPPPGGIAPLVAAALGAASGVAPALAAGEERAAERLLAAIDRAAVQREPAELAIAAAEAARELVAADRAACLLYDPAGDTLEEPAEAGEPRRESAAAGLASWALRTGRAVRVEALADDPRADLEADAPGGSGRERFLAVPAAGPDGPPLAVLTALRGPERPPFDAADGERLALFAWHLAPALHALQLEARLRRAAEAWSAPGAEVPYRRAALARQAAGAGVEGEAVDLAPRWLRWALPLLLIGLAAGLAVALAALRALSGQG